MSEYTMDLDLLVEWNRTKDLFDWQKEILFERLIKERNNGE